MVVAEVVIELDPRIRAAYLAWLRPHVAEILALPGFIGAEAFEVVDPPCEDGWIALCVQYRLVDRAALDAYVRDHSPRLRADGVARFGDAMRTRRRMLAPLPG